MRIYLIGLPGAGKSTIGKGLVQLSGFELIDLDTLIVENEGMSIPDIFSEKGEEYFRQAERNALRETFNKENVIISTGGGTPCFFDNMDEMNENGKTVLLDLDLDEIVFRLFEKDGYKKRPLFANLDRQGVYQKLEEMKKNRFPYYEKAALHLKGNNILPDEVWNELKEQV